MANLSTEDRNQLISMLSRIPLLRSRRGRETVFISAGLEKLLPYVDLEGDTFVTITQTINYLENYGRISYDFEALGSFLNIIKDNFIGIHEQEFLDQILTTYDLMIPVTNSPPIEKWKGQSNDADVLETIIGENTLHDIAFLQQGLAVSNAVACVMVGVSHQGTGFMISPDLLITNNHVLSDASSLSDTIIRFNYQLDFHRKPQEVDDYPVKDSGLFHSNSNLDYTIIEVEGSPGKKWGYLSLSLSKVKIDQRVNIIQHPAGLPKQVSVQNNFVEYVNAKVVQYLTTTMKGSSGSPVCNNDWEVVALHHAGGMILEPRTNRRYFRNEGILISVILEDLPKIIESKI